MSAASTDDSAGGTSFDGRLMDLQPDVPPAVHGGGWRRLVEWSGTSAPVAALLLAGMGLGPNGTALLSTDTLSVLAPAIPVAVAALGVLVGLSVSLGRMDEGRLVLPACLSAVTTLVVVGMGMAALASTESSALSRPLLILIVGAGVCAASSLTLPTGNPLEPRPATLRLVEFEVLVPILVGGGMLAWLHAGGTASASASLAAAAGLICALALAAWLLLTVASNETEERVLTVSALLLVGGVSGALSTSALFGGVVAGALWRYAGRRPLKSIGRDVLFAQHPLVVGLLLIAGASAEISATSLRFAAAYIVFRVAGRLAGGIAARGARGGTASADPISHLLPPGIFGVAFALDGAGVLGQDASALLGAVVLGTVGAELAAFLLAKRRTAA